ncbi:OmpA family protein [Lentzea sp. NBC_00516]|uniref:OmpA family protein n=1 Tax=Lentzea sp. NBC_00516 TaxID=2903582 RepID=UPI002E7FBA4C|nr:OmpA family protein [Lentzea sp. NBC_00516]WUD28732.1 OmpA family protein [Lentzea sp. NBC_00516]
MNDDLDEMLKARHEVFVADLAAALPPARLPHAPPPVRVPWTIRLGGGVITRLDLVVLWFQGFSPQKLVATVAAASLALGVLLVVSDRHGPIDENSLLAVEQPADVPTIVTSTVPANSSAVVPRLTEVAGVAGFTTEELTVLFPPNSADLRESDVEVLRALARALWEDDQVSVVGHTARLGPPATAVDLSLRRAEAVRQELVRGGAAGLAVYTYGEGYERARTGVDARDRRVVVTVRRASA